MSSVLLAALALSGTAHADRPDGTTSPIPTPVPYGLVQSLVTVFDQDESRVADPAGYGDPEDDPGLKLQRARFGFEGKEKGVRYGIIFGMSSPYDAVEVPGDAGIELVDAYGGFRPVKGVWVLVGQQKVPISREMLISSEQLTFTDRSVATEWMAPGRDAGVLVDVRTREDDESGKLVTRLRLGGFNGNGSVLGDDNGGKLVAARAEVAMGKGSVYQTWGKVDGFALGVAGDFWMNGGPTTKTLGYGGDALVRVAGLAVLLEGHMATIEPVDSPVELPGTLASTPKLGITAQAGYTVGAFEPAVRFAMFDDNSNYDDNGDVATAQAGVTWHGHDDAVRAGAGYVLRLETAGVAAANDTARAWFQLAF